jgi:hypothetical protein
MPEHTTRSGEQASRVIMAILVGHRKLPPGGGDEQYSINRKSGEENM